MTDQIILLLVGFTLTTVVGGVLGYYYQRRAWDANRREAERAAAANVFDEISRAMDARLYRMRLLYWGLKQDDTQRIDRALNEYRSTLITWNDNLNRNLALTYRYFGSDVWGFLSSELYNEFSVIGRHLENRYRERCDPRLASEGTGSLYISGRRLQALSNTIYDLNRFMISMIQSGWVGLYLKDTGTDNPPWSNDLHRGSKNTRVVDWQRNLVKRGYGPLDVDGWFGKATLDATVAFQVAAGLGADGIVSEVTRKRMVGMNSSHEALS